MATPELPNQVPDVAIPDLKKKEKERKKAGAAYGAGEGAGGSFNGATGGSGAGASAARAAAAAARGAGAAGVGAEAGAAAGASWGGFGSFGAWLANVFGGEATFLGRLIAQIMSSMIGQVVVAAVAAMMIGGAAIAAAAALGFIGGGNRGASMAANLGAIASNIRVHRDGGSTGLEYAARSSGGQLKFDTGVKKPADAPKTDTKDQQAGDQANGGTPTPDSLERTGMLGGGAGRDRLDHNLSGAKLSTSLGSGGFGGKDIFAGNGPKIGNMDRGKLGASFGANAARNGTTAKMTKRNMAGSKSIAMTRRLRAGDSKALGQLRSMAPLNADMRKGTTATESNAQAAQTQWEGAQPTGATPPSMPDGSTPATPPGNTPTPGTDAPGDIGEKCTQEQINEGMVVFGGVCMKDPTTGYKNVTPWQGMVDMMKTLTALLGVILLACGIMQSLGYILLCSGGASLIAGAAAIIGAVVLGLMVSMMWIMASQVKQMGGGHQADIMFTTAGLFTIAGGTLLALNAAAAAGAATTTAMAIGGIVAAVAAVSGLLVGMIGG